MGCVDGMIEGRFLIRMKRRRGRRIEKKEPVFVVVADGWCGVGVDGLASN